ncbi:cytochrome P450 [Methylobacterium sp. WL30]|nr:cytochrome P450 [Methylobacterium sp. WL93]TXN50103.1 cytochrome P450 [Methylobacterium sp. WL119]TXN65916.1 cytochrome P450 [Methylobacterium sp. WL30]
MAVGVSDDVAERAASAAGDPPIPGMPPRPARRLPTWTFLRTAATNSLAACDAELFERLIVPRNYWSQQVLFVSDPDAIRHVLIDRFDNYPRVTSIRRLFETDLRTGTLASEGEVWRRHRRVATPTIDPRSIRPDIPAMLELAGRIADAVAAEGSTAPVDIERSVGSLSTLLWNQVVTGGDPAGLPILRWLSKVPHKPRLIDLIPKPPWLADRLIHRRRDPALPLLDADLHAMIAARRGPDYAGPHDLLWRLAHGRDRQTGEGLPDAEVRDEAASLIAGGAASVRALTWIWYLLALHPAVEARFHAELDAAMPDGVATPDALDKLPYTRRVLDEVMRLYPPIPAILRQAAARDVVGGHRVRRGAIIAVMPWIVHRHRKLWRDPDLFDPERFTEGNGVGRPRLAYLPFATGPRVCVGASFALTQMLVVIAVLGRRFRFRLASDAPVVPFGAISLQPKGGLPVLVEPR